MSLEQLRMVREYQCSGCVVGSDPKTCGSFELQEEKNDFYRCIQHVSGTRVYPGGNIYLGLPKGFNKVGAVHPDYKSKTHIRIHPEDSVLPWDRLNVAVWGMEQDGTLFVRTYCPRVNDAFIDILPGRTMAVLPEGVIDVGEFIDEID